MSTQPELSIIIVNWNGEKILSSCIKSIDSHPPRVRFELIVVDNNSSDNSVTLLRELSKNVSFRLKVIENAENVGFGRGCNIGFKETSAEFVMFLNPDTEVQDGCFNFLTDFLIKHDDVAAVGPKLLLPTGEIQASVWNNPPRLAEMILPMLRVDRLMPHRWRAKVLRGQYFDYSAVASVDMIPGTAIMLRSEVFRNLGGFDERFFMYGEDLELSYRILRAGWKMYFVPMAEVLHLDGSSSITRWGQAGKRYEQAKGNLFYLRCVKSPLSFRMFLLVLVFGSFFQYVVDLMRNREAPAVSKKLIKLYLRNFGQQGSVSELRL